MFTVYVKQYNLKKQLFADLNKHSATMGIYCIKLETTRLRVDLRVVLSLRRVVPLAELSPDCDKHGWLVGCFGFNGPLRQYFSLYRAVS